MATLADVGAVSILYMCTYAATVLVLVILKLRRTIGMLYNTIPVLLNELSWKASVVGSSLVCINWLVILISPLIACESQISSQHKQLLTGDITFLTTAIEISVI